MHPVMMKGDATAVTGQCSSSNMAGQCNSSNMAGWCNSSNRAMSQHEHLWLTGVNQVSNQNCWDKKQNNNQLVH